MASKVTHIDATFGGKSRRFEIARDKLTGFEYLAGQSAYSLFTKIAANGWTIDDLERVLGCALMDWSAPESRLNRVTLNALRLAVGPLRGSGAIVIPPAITADVRRVFEGAGPARYAPLALMILEASLFGVDASDNVFNENASEAV